MDTLRCSYCGAIYQIVEGIPSFVESNEFYETKYVEPRGSFIDPKTRFWNSRIVLATPVRLAKTLEKLYCRLYNHDIRFIHMGFVFRAVPRGEQVVLDIGCGGGVQMYKKFGYVCGLDLSASSLRHAREKSGYDMVVQANGCEMPFADNTFDLVLSMDTIEHVPVNLKDRLFSEMYRVLKPGGRQIHNIICDAKNPLISLAKRHSDLYTELFVEADGHYGLELASKILSRFDRLGMKRLMMRKWGINFWWTGAYINMFRRYANKSLLLATLVLFARAVTHFALTKEVANLLLGIASETIDNSVLFPVDLAEGLLVCYEKLA